MAAEELEQLRVQVARLEEQLAEEQHLRRAAEAATEAVAADRSRLQRARDELAAALLAAEKRVLEAEEEAAAAHAAAAAAQQQLQAGGGGTGGQQGTLQREQQQARAAGVSPSPQRRQLTEEEAADAEVLLAALDQERQRSEELVRTLEAAEREAVSATEKLLKAQAKIEQLKAKGKAKDKGGVSGIPPSPSLASLDGGEAVEALQARIAALKASRDKLIGAFDAQAAEIERLSGDNAALAESLAQLRDAAAKWEAQAQASLAQNERLKDLLEESATWSIPAAPGSASAPSSSVAGGGGSTAAAAAVQAAEALTAAAAAAGSPRVGEGGGSGAAGAGSNGAAGGSSLAELCRRFERELLLEKARSTQLDLQVRALCMELTRAAQSSGQMQAALLPMLGGVEARLVQVLGLKARQGPSSALLGGQHARWASGGPLSGLLEAASGLVTRPAAPAYPTHVPLNGLEKGAVALLSLWGAFRNPWRGDLVASAGETTGLPAIIAMRERMRRSEVGRQILAERPLITDDVVGPCWDMPEHTFGGAYARFMGSRGFLASGRPPCRFIDDPELAYVITRARQVHDFWHVLFGCHTNGFGEVALKAVEFVQTGLPMTGLAVLAGEWRFKPEDRALLNREFLPWALRAGARAPDLMCIYYEKHFEDNLEELRLRWRIEPAPAAPQNAQPQRGHLPQPGGEGHEPSSDAPSAPAAAGAPAAA
ncbi:ubiquinone biosynthesis [Chlorella sorokiniana]|uniref:Ubiquinone biosynthesis protein COQ4 homolog, mitochondrial n=1 Tax=Chlorella sorokiniana TaxID=3076 RepID=A0A2P6TFU9_CHLSO|nr:ubiquinone biosynthesis [Chlorella sorokiniana]|eukprot:PRW32984.1 ubiquinone biosynthesis [Chlorella sorokiniana]